jgi:hypothetical protein
MERNTVVLSLEEYNALRDFKSNLEKGNTYRTYKYTQLYNGSYMSGVIYISTDEAVKEATALGKEQYEKIVALEKDNALLRQGILKEQDGKRDQILGDVKRMSIWKFLGWRKK